MFDYFRIAPWGDWYLIMSKGNPPLALQFLIINCAFFVIFAIRRIRGEKTKHNNISYLVHGLMFLANVGILYQSDLLPMYQTRIMMFWHKLQYVI
jgi:hypothetical membrane protein